MKRYNHSAIEKKWQKEWSKKKVYRALGDSKKKKKYVLDMFPYPSGAGLHVGHPKGYIGSDVYARMKRMQGFNVLHPMGYDAFGLPAEQYAVTHNIHPRKAVLENVKTFENQLSIIGLSYDWDRKVNTTDPEYYRWTQWIFLQIYNSWYDKKKDKAEPIETLIKRFAKEGNAHVDAVVDENTPIFTSTEWKSKSPKERQEILMKYRLAYEGFAEVNWCPELGTVLANDEVLDGPNGSLVSERGGFPVEKKQMRQWFMRITAYADRLLSGLETIDWPSNIKEIQRNWIGKSEGALLKFKIEKSKIKITDQNVKGEFIEIFTTRADTLFGATYVVLAPEHKLILNLKSEILNWEEVQKYITGKNPTPGVGEKTGIKLDGVMAVNPANGEKIPVFVADYVLSGYGTGAVMGVPAHDERDFQFAEKYNVPIKEVVLPNIIDKRNPPIVGKKVVERKNVHPIVLDPKTGKYLALKWKTFDWVTFPMGGVEEGEDIVEAAKREVKEETGFTNLKLIKVLQGQARAEYFAAHKDQNRVSYTTAVLFELVDHTQIEISEEEQRNHDVIWLDEAHLDYEHMTHAEVGIWKDKRNANHGAYLGPGILINSGEFSGLTDEEARTLITKKVGGKIVTKYKMRNAIFARQRYWGEPIPLFYDKDGIIGEVNKLPLELPNVKSYQPTGTGESPLASVPAWVKKGYETNTMPGWAGSSWYFLRYMDPKNKKEIASKKALSYWGQVDMYVGGAEHATGHLLYSRFWNKFLKDIGVVTFEEPFKTLRNQGMIQGADGRKMSKRWGNVINPDDVVKTYGADTLRVYEMFMGPFEAGLPWSTENIIGSRRFVERVWRVQKKIKDQKSPARPHESTRSGAGGKIKIEEEKKLETLIHQTIQKVTGDIDTFSMNTAVSAMMILLNEMEKSEKIEKKHFEIFLKLMHPFAPHVTEELWKTLGNKTTLVIESWPKADPQKMKSSEVTIAVQINGKVRGEVKVATGSTQDEVLQALKSESQITKWLGQGEYKKVIYIENRLINIVI